MHVCSPREKGRNKRETENEGREKKKEERERGREQKSERMKERGSVSMFVIVAPTIYHIAHFFTHTNIFFSLFFSFFYYVSPKINLLSLIISKSLFFFLILIF